MLKIFKNVEITAAAGEFPVQKCTAEMTSSSNSSQSHSQSTAIHLNDVLLP